MEKWLYYGHMTVVQRNCHFSVVHLTSAWAKEKLIKT